jgi:hypothetical protein
VPVPEAIRDDRLRQHLHRKGHPRRPRLSRLARLLVLRAGGAVLELDRLPEPVRAPLTLSSAQYIC